MTDPNDQVDIKDEDIKEEDFTLEELDDDTTDWKAKAEELKGIAKRRATQLGKAKEKLKSLSSQPNKPQEPAKKEPDNTQKSSELDFGQKAYLKTFGVSGADELALVKSELARSGEDFDTLLENPYFKTRLDSLREARATSLAVPSGTKRSNVSTKDSTEYHLEKYESGQMKLNEMPFDMRSKVLTAKMDKDKRASEFSFVPSVQ